jgi:hypothetical protein
VLPQTRGQPALACSGSSYAPAYNRLRTCLACQSGLQAPPGLTTPQSDKLEVCQVPPGRFWELNVVRECPKGLYRSNWVKTDNRSAIACLSCPAGWSTAATGSQAVGMCNGEGCEHSAHSNCCSAHILQLQAGPATKQPSWWQVHCSSTPCRSSSSSSRRTVAGWSSPDHLQHSIPAHCQLLICTVCLVAPCSATSRVQNGNCSARPGARSIRSGQPVTRRAPTSSSSMPNWLLL